ncbi:MAG: four helix bundle protein [Bacteroidaceae bacterium]
MGVKIGSTVGYMYMDVWVLTSIVQLGTFSFCRRFLNSKNDPCGRLFDQMTQAARSCQANIAEGSSRHQTSIETEMKLMDVARASINELSNDFLFILMANRQVAWRNNDPNAIKVRAVKLDMPHYGEDIMHDVMEHVLRQKERFDPWIEHGDITCSARALIILCARVNSMITRHLENSLATFKQAGGFAENMTKERIEAQCRQSEEEGAPWCPKCGAPMVKRYAKRGSNQGRAFWSCSKFTETGCTGSRNIPNQ